MDLVGEHVEILCSVTVKFTPYSSQHLRFLSFKVWHPCFCACRLHRKGKHVKRKKGDLYNYPFSTTFLIFTA